MEFLKQDVFEHILKNLLIDIDNRYALEQGILKLANNKKIDELDYDDKFTMEIKENCGKIKKEYKIKQLKELFDEKVSLTKKEDSFFIYDNKVLYLLIETNGRYNLSGKFDKYKTESDEFKYSIEKVPLEVYLKILNEMEKFNPRVMLMMRLKINWDEFKTKSQNDELKDFFETRGKYLVLKSELLQESNVDIKTRKNLLMTYYFKLLDLGKQYRIVEEDRLNGKIRPSFDGNKEIKIAPPLKSYNVDLIKMFGEANASSNPFTKFIEYYQVIEYFFGKAYNDDLREELEQKLYAVDFSLENKVDLSALEGVMKKFLKNKENERQMLKRVLKDYVDLDKLSYKLKDNCDFYSKAEKRPIFLKENDKSIFFNINSEDKDKVYNSMTNRIYKVRNALVHNKQNDKNSYQPQKYKHVRSLNYEIPLIKEVAALCITSSSIE